MQPNNANLAKSNIKKSTLFGAMSEKLLASFFSKAQTVLTEAPMRDELAIQDRLKREFMQEMNEIERIMQRLRQIARDYAISKKASDTAGKTARPLVAARRVKQVRQRLASQEKSEIFQK